VPRITFTTVLRILLASLLVGMAMAFLDIQPGDILHWLTGSLDEALANAQAWAGWTVKYVLLGAVVVVPIWVLWHALQLLRRR
jgi:flagellar biosynthesis protein FlhB